MVVKLIRFFRGYLYVSLTGYSPERFMNLCGNAGIVLWNIKPDEDGYCFFISLQAFRRLRPILKKSGTHVRIKKKIGLPFMSFRYRYHRFFAVGLGGLLVILFAMSGFIWKVDVSGNCRYSTQVMLDYLKQEGIGYGTCRRRIHCEEVETLLRKQFPDIIWVSARISGTRFCLEMQEKLDGTLSGKSEGVTTETATDLLADVPGTVESIAVRRGTPLVKQMDLVKDGTILVSGELPLEDDNGEVAGYEYCNADADVYIRTTLPVHISFPAQKTRLVNTKSCRYGMVLIFGSRQISFFEHQEMGNIIYNCYLHPKIGRDFYLPCQVIWRKQEAYKVEKIPYSKQEIQKVAEKKLFDYCKKLEENAIQILEKSVIIETTDTEVSVQGSLEALVKATRRAETEKTTRQEGTGTYGINTADVGHSD